MSAIKEGRFCVVRFFQKSNIIVSFPRRRILFLKEFENRKVDQIEARFFSRLALSFNPLRQHTAPFISSSRTFISSSRTFSSSSAQKQEGLVDNESLQKDNKLLLVRDYIFTSLYNQENGYFGKFGSDIITAPSRLNKYIDFKTLTGYWDYQKAVAKMYSSNPGGWMTPVEIFAPFYSQAIARYILECYLGNMNGVINAQTLQESNTTHKNIASSSEQKSRDNGKEDAIKTNYINSKTNARKKRKV